MIDTEIITRLKSLAKPWFLSLHRHSNSVHDPRTEYRSTHFRALWFFGSLKHTNRF